jgi:hypothetical protein
MAMGILAMGNSCFLHVCFIFYLLQASRSSFNIFLVRQQLPWAFAVYCAVFIALLLLKYGTGVAIITGLSSSVLLCSLKNAIYKLRTLDNVTQYVVIIFPGLCYGEITFSNSYILSESFCLNFINNFLIFLLSLLAARCSGKMSSVCNAGFWATVQFFV